MTEKTETINVDRSNIDFLSCNVRDRYRSLDPKYQLSLRCRQRYARIIAKRKVGDGAHVVKGVCPFHGMGKGCEPLADGFIYKMNRRTIIIIEENDITICKIPKRKR